MGSDELQALRGLTIGDTIKTLRGVDKEVEGKYRQPCG
jgi:hypothetical protein